jgi:hypothetical protein
LSHLVSFIINNTRRALQSELDSFFDQTLDTEHCQTVTKSAFCQARKSLNPQSLRDLLQQSAKGLSTGFDAPRWHGLRVIALDSSLIRVPNNTECATHFGYMNTSCGKKRPLARASALWDVARECFVDATLGKYAEDDRTLAFKHLSQLSSQDLVVMDRGYPSRDWMTALQQQQIPFCARITTTQWRAVKQFILSGKSDQVHDMGTPKQSLNLRLLKYQLPNGTRLVLVTNVLSKTLTPADFSQLYRHRWRIEEAFKHIKSRLQVENWSGILPLATEQDFYATLIRTNCAACLRLAARPLADTLEAANEPSSNGWRNKLNRAYSVTSLNPHLSRLILFTPCQKVLKTLLLRLQAPSNYVMTKPNRLEKRVIGVRIHGFHPPYKVA